LKRNDDRNELDSRNFARRAINRRRVITSLDALSRFHNGDSAEEGRGRWGEREREREREGEGGREGGGREEEEGKGEDSPRLPRMMF